MPFFHRDRDLAGDRGEDPGDDPASLRSALRPLRQLVDRSGGRLPVEATVAARRLIDLLTRIVEESADRPLEPEVVVSVRSTVEDYLPTSIRSYLSVEESSVDVARADGRTPRASLLEQLDDLETAATELLHAIARRDVDALMTQGSFLRTKFSRSDLAL